MSDTALKTDYFAYEVESDELDSNEFKDGAVKGCGKPALGLVNKTERVVYPQDEGGVNSVAAENNVGAKNAVVSKRSADTLLVQAVLAGNTKAFDMLVIKYQGQIASALSRYINDAETIRDLTQESFLRAYKGLQRFRADSQFYTWLYRIAINTAFNFMSAGKNKAITATLDDTGVQLQVDRLTKQSGPDSKLHSQDLEHAIKQAIDGLNESARTALVLREYENMSYEQIAQVQNCPVGTIRSRIARAREHIVQKTQNLYCP